MSVYKKIDEHLYASRYFYLLAATLLMVFLASFFPDRSNYFINELTFSLFMLANINFIRHNKRIIIIMILFALFSVLMAWVPNESSLGQKFLVSERIIVIIFISIIIYLIISQIAKSKIVTVNMILGVITIYILFGLMAGDCNQLIYYFDTHAFTGNIDPTDISDLRYYSYVTMTTLGYGDISPDGALARSVSTFIALTGQLYLVIIMALIIGKFLKD